MRKTPKIIIEIIMTHNDMRNAINKRAGVSISNRVASLTAINTMLESILKNRECYNGYRYVTTNGYPSSTTPVIAYNRDGLVSERDLILEASRQYFIKY